jgi:hypothetical protein
MPQLVMTSCLKRVLMALLVVGAISDSARPVLLDERQLRLAETPALLVDQGKADSA